MIEKYITEISNELSVDRTALQAIFAQVVCASRAVRERPHEPCVHIDKNGKRCRVVPRSENERCYLHRQAITDREFGKLADQLCREESRETRERTRNDSVTVVPRNDANEWEVRELDNDIRDLVMIEVRDGLIDDARRFARRSREKTRTVRSA